MRIAWIFLAAAAALAAVSVAARLASWALYLSAGLLVLAIVIVVWRHLRSGARR